MFDYIREKFAMISKLGSFWYHTIEDDAAIETAAITHIPYILDIGRFIGYAADFALGKSRLRRTNFVIRIRDTDVEQVDNGFKLYVDPNLLVTQCKTSSGDVYTRGAGIDSGYGYIVFDKDPRAIFTDLKLFVKSAVQRIPNVLCYSLGVQDVYGDVSQIVKYYRNNQSPMQFYKAAAQAAGMQVIRKTDIIREVIQVENRKYSGTSYITQGGDRYDAWYPHVQLNIGQTVAEGQVIGQENFNITMPNQELDSSIDGIYLGHNTPVPGLFVPTTEITIYQDGVFKPEYIGDDLENYHAYLEKISPAEQGDQQAQQPGVQHFRNVVAPGRTLIVYINTQLGYDICNRLKRFINVNSPLGSVVVFAHKTVDG